MDTQPIKMTMEPIKMWLRTVNLGTMTGGNQESGIVHRYQCNQGVGMTNQCERQ